MSLLAALKASRTRQDLAALLGFSGAGLSYILYRIPPNQKYTQFQIPKRSGGFRQIHAPVPRLKLVQTRLAALLYSCMSEIVSSEVSPRRVLSHGFAKGYSIVSNASRHQRRRQVLNVDLEDFFPSFNFGRVRGYFIKDTRFNLAIDVATTIAQIACHNNELPQGSPCSPPISNLMTHFLDVRLARLAKRHRVTYSRYADDLTFSTNNMVFPTELANLSQGSASVWIAGNTLNRELVKAGFRVNSKKTRMQIKGSRQVVTGLVVNDKVNTTPEYYRNTRSMCSALFRTGTFFVDPSAVTPPTIHHLQGRLSHLWYVRNTMDRREPAEKKKHPTATRQLYYKFLFYKHFYSLERPIVLTEGKTDAVYLKCALASLYASFPTLVKRVGSANVRLFDFMNYTKTIHEIMQLGRGTGDFKFLIIDYKKNLARLGNKRPQAPVIMVVDNDDGAKDIFSVAKIAGSPDVSWASTAPFYHIVANLYLVKTPEGVISPKSAIEDLFDPTLLTTIVDGKTFDPAKAHQASGKYGKHIFAERVVRPQAHLIDFSGFSPLLDRIAAVAADYATKLATPVGP